MLLDVDQFGTIPACVPPERPSTSWPAPRTVKRLASIHAVALAVVALLSQNAAHAQRLSAADRALFENKIRPVLVQHCYECHAADAKELGGKLRLDTREAMRQGGQSGPALIAGKPDASLIIQALRYDGVEMPPQQPLPPTVVEDFARWIRRGAPDPRTADSTAKKQPPDDGETLWSLQPVNKPSVPQVQDAGWPRDPVDRFVLARIEAGGLIPAGDADPRTLVRRLYYDLIGLPPSLAEIERFVAAHRRDGAQAAEQLVDSLLARPQFGEHWGRMWLDVVRFGESNGNDGLGRNPTFPHAWRYRDYVVAAFNADTPYDRFLTEQIAGDLLPSDSPEQRDRQLVATGMLAMASKPAKAMNNNFEMDVVADQLHVVGRGILGLSVGCARCHDHKFDPIPTRDYYALAGIFTSTETLWGVAAHERLTAPVTDLHVLKSAPKVPPPKGFVETVRILDPATAKPKPIPKSKWPPGTPLAMGVRDAKKPADCKLNMQGDAKRLGKPVPRGFLTACSFDSLDAVQIDPKQSGRLQLARWLAHDDHPLTARVMVNRIWQQLFGEGIVRTPDDFGVYGQRPTHPQLLDHLASRLVGEGWSIKRTIRAIVLSRTYQLASGAEQRLLKADPQNLLQARHSRRRLTAEALRDSMLLASGQLNLQPGDGSIIRHRDILVNLAGNLHQPSQYRSVYLCYLRSAPPPELAAFDLPDFTEVTGQRDVSTVPGQALHLYNSPFVVEQAACFARRIMKETGDDEGRVRVAYRRALGREPDPVELEGALQLVRQTAAALRSDSQSDDKAWVHEKAWASLCQALMVTNEFRYID